jgi:hypothetical protein
MSSLFGLAPGGVYRAAPVAGSAVRSYRTLSPLPAGPLGRAGGLLSVALSLGSPPPGVTRHRISVEPGLSSPKGHPLRAVIWPSGGAELRDCQGALQQDCNEISKFEDEPCLVEACLNNLLTKRYLVVVQQASQTPDRLTAARSTRMKTESSPYPTRSGMKCRWKAVAATRVCGLSTPVGSTS